MPKINHPAPFAITIAGDEDRTHYFDDREEFDDFVRGLLVGEDELREFSTDFKLYKKAPNAWWEWHEFELNPYDYFRVEDTDYPVAHGQLLAKYGQWVNHKILWDVAQGRYESIELIEDESIRAMVANTFRTLEEAGVWDEPELDFDDELTEEDELVAQYGLSNLEFVRNQEWIADLVPEDE